MFKKSLESLENGLADLAKFQVPSHKGVSDGGMKFRKMLGSLMRGRGAGLVGKWGGVKFGKISGFLSWRGL
jgi:hypothetical protein